MSKYEIFQKQNGNWVKIGGTEAPTPDNMMTTNTPQTITVSGMKTFDMPIGSQRAIRVQCESDILTDMMPDGIYIKEFEGASTLYGNGTIHVENTSASPSYSADLTLPATSGILAVRPTNGDFVDTVTADQEMTANKIITIGATNQGLRVRDSSSSEVYYTALYPKEIDIGENKTSGNIVTRYMADRIRKERTSGGATLDEFLFPYSGGRLVTENDLPAEEILYDTNAITWNHGLATYSGYMTYTCAYGNHMIVEIATNATIIPNSGQDGSITIGTLKTPQNIATTMATGVVYSRALGHFVPCNVVIGYDKTVTIYYQTYMGVIDGLRFNGIVRVW